MEEDIKILKELTEEYNSQHYMDMPLINGKQIQALENLLKGYRELEREKEMHKNNSNKLYKDYNKLTDEFDLLNKENNRNKETIKRYRKYLNKKDKRFKEALENEYQERETDYIPKSKIKEKIEENQKMLDKSKNNVYLYFNIALQELMEE